MQSDKNVVMIVAQKDFRDEEFEIPKRILEDAGIGVKIASSQAGECFGINGTVASAEMDLSQISPNDFDGILFVGGPGVQSTFNDESILRLATQFAGDNKILAAICWATVILANAGLIKGKNVTTWSGAKADIEKAGGIYHDQPVVVDGNIITADGPTSAEEFGLAISNVLMG